MSRLLLFVGESIAVVMAVVVVFADEWSMAAACYGLACWLHLTRREVEQ